MIRWRIALLMFLARTIIAYFLMPNNRLLIRYPQSHLLILFNYSDGQDILMMPNKVRKYCFHEVKERPHGSVGH